MTKRFAIRGKPSKPVRLKSESHEKNIAYVSLQEVVDIAKEWGAPLGECDVEIERGYGYGCDCTVLLSWSGPEPIQLFQERMDKYEKGLESYEVWAEEFKDEIAVELEVRKLLKEELARVLAQTKVDKLTKELAKNQKKLEALS